MFIKTVEVTSNILIKITPLLTNKHVFITGKRNIKILHDQIRIRAVGGKLYEGVCLAHSYAENIVTRPEKIEASCHSRRPHWSVSLKQYYIGLYVLGVSSQKNKNQHVLTRFKCSKYNVYLLQSMYTQLVCTQIKNCIACILLFVDISLIYSLFVCCKLIPNSPIRKRIF